MTSQTPENREGLITRREFLIGIGVAALGGASAAAIKKLGLITPPEETAKEPLPIESNFKLIADKLHKREDGFTWQDIEVVVNKNQFGEEFEPKTAENFKTASKLILDIFGRAYPLNKMSYKTLVIRPVNPDIIEIICQKNPELCKETDYSKMPFVVYPEKSDPFGIKEGIYWHKKEFKGGINEVGLLAHEMFHFLYRRPEHNGDRFGTYGASAIVQYYLENGTMPRNDFGPFQALAKKAEKYPCFCHMIEDGDTLAGIAEKYGTTVELISKTNNIVDNQLQTGKRIAVPTNSEILCGCF